MMKKVFVSSFSNVFYCFQPCERMRSMRSLVEIRNKNSISKVECVDKFFPFFRPVPQAVSYLAVLKAKQLLMDVWTWTPLAIGIAKLLQLTAMTYEIKLF